METNKKITFKFAAAPVALFSITNSNEFKLITYLVNTSNITNNSTVSVSYSYLSKACNITCNKVIKRAIDSLITLGLISRISGNITTNNSYTINYARILELENTNEAINEVPEQPMEEQPQSEQPEQPEQPMEEPTQEEQPQPMEEPAQEEQPQPIIEEKINNNMEEKEINNEELFAKVEEFILTKNNDEFFDWHETIEYLGAYFTKEERIFIKNNFDTFKKRQNLFRLYDRIKMELIAPTYTEKKEVKKEEEEFLPF